MKITLYDEDIQQLFDGFTVVKLINGKMIEVQLTTANDIIEDRANDYD